MRLGSPPAPHLCLSLDCTSLPAPTSATNDLQLLFLSLRLTVLHAKVTWLTGRRYHIRFASQICCKMGFEGQLIIPFELALYHDGPVLSLLEELESSTGNSVEADCLRKNLQGHVSLSFRLCSLQLRSHCGMYSFKNWCTCTLSSCKAEEFRARL